MLYLYWLSATLPQRCMAGRFGMCWEWAAYSADAGPDGGLCSRLSTLSGRFVTTSPSVMMRCLRISWIRSVCFSLQLQS